MPDANSDSDSQTEASNKHLKALTKRYESEIQGKTE